MASNDLTEPTQPVGDKSRGKRLEVKEVREFVSFHKTFCCLRRFMEFKTSQSDFSKFMQLLEAVWERRPDPSMLYVVVLIQRKTYGVKHSGTLAQSGGGRRGCSGSWFRAELVDELSLFPHCVMHHFIHFNSPLLPIAKKEMNVAL